MFERPFHRNFCAGFTGTRKDPGDGRSLNRGLILSLKLAANAAKLTVRKSGYNRIPFEMLGSRQRSGHFLLGVWVQGEFFLAILLAAMGVRTSQTIVDFSGAFWPRSVASNTPPPSQQKSFGCEAAKENIHMREMKIFRFSLNYLLSHSAKKRRAFPQSLNFNVKMKMNTIGTIVRLGAPSSPKKSSSHRPSSPSSPRRSSVSKVNRHP